MNKVKKWAIDVINDIDIKNKRKKMISNVAMQKAKKIYKEKTGKEMTTSRLNVEMLGMTPDDNTDEYLENKKLIKRDLKKKMETRGVL